MNRELGIPRFDYNKESWYTRQIEQKEKLLKKYKDIVWVFWCSDKDEEILNKWEYKDPNSNIHVYSSGNMRRGYRDGRQFVYQAEPTGLPDDHVFSTLPNFMTKDGHMFWFKEGKTGRNTVLHRNNDLPAIVKVDWFKLNGKFVTTGKIVSLAWFQDGKLHRDDGPALIYFGTKGATWYKRGVEFRYQGCSEIVNKHYSCSKVTPDECLNIDVEEAFVDNRTKFKHFDLFEGLEIKRITRTKTTNLTTEINGEKVHYKVKAKVYLIEYEEEDLYEIRKKKVLHREDGPAIEYYYLSNESCPLPKDKWAINGSYLRGRLFEEEMKRTKKVKSARSVHV